MLWSSGEYSFAAVWWEPREYQNYDSKDGNSLGYNLVDIMMMEMVDNTHGVTDENKMRLSYFCKNREKISKDAHWLRLARN